MPRPAIDFDIELKVEFEEISNDEIPAFSSGLLLLLQWIKEAKVLETTYGTLDVDLTGNFERSVPALLPLEAPVEG